MNRVKILIAFVMIAVGLFGFIYIVNVAMMADAFFTDPRVKTYFLPASLIHPLSGGLLVGAIWILSSEWGRRKR